MPKLGEDAETRLTVAALAAAIVRSAEHIIPGLSAHAIVELDALQNEMRYWDSEPTGAIETIRWTRELLERKFVIP
jgi:hypothetical protein